MIVCRILIKVNEVWDSKRSCLEATNLKYQCYDVCFILPDFCVQLVYFRGTQNIR